MDVFDVSMYMGVGVKQVRDLLTITWLRGECHKLAIGLTRLVSICIKSDLFGTISRLDEFILHLSLNSFSLH